MTIHTGDTYTITSDGATAIKSDGKTSRKMKYHPERDISAIAGEIDESDAWRILHDVATQLCGGCRTPVCPEHILIDGDGFVLSEWSGSRDGRFTAPEGYEPVWALGATAFQVFLGCHVFQGLGGKGQTRTAPVPTLRRELPELSNLIARCLDFDPKRRPSMGDVVKTASENLERCIRNKSEFPPLKPSESMSMPASADEIDRYWPEEM